MDTLSNDDANGSIMNKTEVGSCLDDEEVEEAHANEEEDDSDLNSLLPPRRGGMSKKYDEKHRKVQWKDSNGNLLSEVLKSGETHRKVHWKDNNGNMLAEVLIYEPSDVSDSDDEESDHCICTIM
ncbi:hypothetical protein Lalb_Chr03g0037011 [Lupinus albus]|uniref:Uncharacterized protein n=1 Tax=Lupinus albus TaxID=3870 RepID=A0A6A4QS44_LUPAL|nr:hypothetical protein Lalb_Chr03g0037011 [Lupinus albus]